MSTRVTSLVPPGTVPFRMQQPDEHPRAPVSCGSAVLEGGV